MFDESRPQGKRPVPTLPASPGPATTILIVFEPVAGAFESDDFGVVSTRTKSTTSTLTRSEAAPPQRRIRVQASSASPAAQSTR